MECSLLLGEPLVLLVKVKLRFGGSTFTPGAALCPTRASNLKFVSDGSGRTISGRVGLLDKLGCDGDGFGAFV